MPTPMVSSRRMNDEDDTKLMRIIRKQNDMIERLADRLGEQQRSLAEKQKRDMEEKLRMLELETTIRQEEARKLELERLESTKKHKKLKKLHKRQPSLMDFFGKMILAKNLGTDLFNQSSDSEEEDDGIFSTRRKKKERYQDQMNPMIMNPTPHYGMPRVNTEIMSPGFRGVNKS